MSSSSVEQLTEKLECALATLGFEMVAARVQSSSGKVQLLIDSDSGVTLSDCERVSRQVSGLLLVEDFDYSVLEVSSPGPNRPLNKLKDFKKFQGHWIALELKSDLSGQKKFYGLLESIVGNVIELNCTTEKHFFDINEIRMAKLAMISPTKKG